MDRKVPFLQGEFYHIYNRGIDKRKIFFSAGDWHHFQRLLYLRNSRKRIDTYRVKGKRLQEIDTGEPLVDIYAYALMPNHFHILVRSCTDGGVSIFMSKLLTSFSMYMNQKYERTGPLMCRPFRARHVDSDEYLRWLVTYIHLNPLELYGPEKRWKEIGVSDVNDAKQFLESFHYSSYVDRISDTEREEKIILTKADGVMFSQNSFQDFDLTSISSVLGES